MAGSAAAQSAAPSVFEVKPGDTFSSIAAAVTGDTRTWAQLYDDKLSRLADPNVIYPGMRFELISDGAKRYLRLADGRASAKPPALAVASSGAKPQQPATARPAPTTTAPPSAQASSTASTTPATTPPPSLGPEPAEIVLGVLPNIASSTLLTQYESWKNYFERVNAPTKVRITVPPTFKAFFEAMMRGDYDLAVAAPNFARTAQLEAKFVPLVMYEPRIMAQFVTTADNPVASPQDVKGKVVAFANPQSLLAFYGQQWLRGMGLEPGRDYEPRGTRTDVGVGRLLLSGEASAAIMSNSEFNALPRDESSRLKIAEVFARIPNFITVGHPRLGQERLDRYRGQLLQFLADKDDGAAFGRATGLAGVVEVGDSTLKELDPYVPATRRAMGLSQ